MTQNELNDFYSKVSFSGLLILFAFKLSLEKSIAFDRDDLGKAVQVINPDYLLGFIVACTSFNIIKYNIKGKVITVTFIDPLIASTIEGKIMQMSHGNEFWSKWHVNLTEYFK